MYKVYFLANDPGGLDVIKPTFELMREKGEYDCELMCTGFAGQGSIYKKAEADILLILKGEITDNKTFILVTGTSWNSDIELKAIKLCKENGKKTVSILDFWGNYKERFSYKNEIIYPDKYLIMDEVAYEACIETGIPKEILYVVGHPGLDYYVNHRVKHRENRKILFLSQPLSLLYNNELGYNEFNTFEDILNASKKTGYSVKIRFHPKETEQMRKRYGAYMAEDGILEEIISNYNIVMGMHTMGLLQCVLMGMPTISYEPNMKCEERCISTVLGITESVHSYERLIEVLGEKITMGDITHTPIWFDGESTQRCIEEIAELCK